jgi:hypothetical protein
LFFDLRFGELALQLLPNATGCDFRVRWHSPIICLQAFLGNSEGERRIRKAHARARVPAGLLHPILNPLKHSDPTPLFFDLQLAADITRIRVHVREKLGCI